MDEIKKELMERLLSAYRGALEDGGIDKICQTLAERKARNVEDEGEQRAQLTFDLRNRIEINNDEFAIAADVKISEKNTLIFHAEETFSLSGQQELPLNGSAGAKAPEAKE